MDALVKGATSNSRMVLTILVVALIAGATTYVNLSKEADPDVPIPIIGISVPLKGALSLSRLFCWPRSIVVGYKGVSL